MITESIRDMMSLNLFPKQTNTSLTFPLSLKLNISQQTEAGKVHNYKHTEIRFIKLNSFFCDQLIARDGETDAVSMVTQTQTRVA